MPPSLAVTLFELTVVNNWYIIMVSSGPPPPLSSLGAGVHFSYSLHRVWGPLSCFSGKPQCTHHPGSVLLAVPLPPSTVTASGYLTTGQQYDMPGPVVLCQLLGRMRQEDQFSSQILFLK